VKEQRIQPMKKNFNVMLLYSCMREYEPMLFHCYIVLGLWCGIRKMYPYLREIWFMDLLFSLLEVFGMMQEIVSVSKFSWKENTMNEDRFVCLYILCYFQSCDISHLVFYQACLKSGSGFPSNVRRKPWTRPSTCNRMQTTTFNMSKMFQCRQTLLFLFWVI
jgi:hypothetical protein